PSIECSPLTRAPPRSAKPSARGPSSRSRGSSTRAWSPPGCRAGGRATSARWTTAGSDPWRRAGPGDVAPRGRDRPDKNAARVALVVVRGLVDEHHITGQPGELGQQLGHRDGEPQVHERVGYPAPADPERPVAGHPGDHPVARVDDAQVVEAGDVDPVAHE